jgi:hypothetical protein
VTLTAAQLAEIRDWVTWDPPTDSDLQATYTGLGFQWAVVVRYLRRRLQEFIANPAQFSLPGDYSQNTAANISALRDSLSRAEGLLAVEMAEAGSGGVARLSRRDPLRDCPNVWPPGRAADAVS